MNSSASRLARTGPLRREGALGAAAFPSSPPSVIPDLSPRRRASAPQPASRPPSSETPMPRLRRRNRATVSGGSPALPDQGNPSSGARVAASLCPPGGCVRE
ncbi:hypothetical protein Zm00014a_024822 [Zea mays]|uniref:Uncharacterized protein n=1 Tax=Zea mays TaxID=4577 RepID=A0A3L6DHJ4_MAIZE|nr:hypothetical protein Zm00014a_024822 [Zea mays]